MRNRHPATLGLIIAVIAAASFGMSGAFIKPLLESGWSPVAAVTARVLIGGVVLLPFALVAVRGRWAAVWRGRWRLLGMALVGVAGTQVLYFAAIQRIPVSTGILVEYLAPVLLVAVVWARTRKAPRAVVVAGSVVAVAGLILVVSPGGAGALDPLGLILAVLAMVGCAGFYLIAARPSDGLPPVALASGGLLLGGLALGVVGATGLLPVTVSFADVPLFGSADGVVGAAARRRRRRDRDRLRREHHRDGTPRLPSGVVHGTAGGRGGDVLRVAAAGRGAQPPAIAGRRAHPGRDRARARGPG